MFLQSKFKSQQECMAVLCVPPASVVSTKACTFPRGVSSRGGGVPSRGKGVYLPGGVPGICHSASRALDVRKTRRITTEPQLV